MATKVQEETATEAAGRRSTETVKLKHLRMAYTTTAPCRAEMSPCRAPCQIAFIRKSFCPHSLHFNYTICILKPNGLAHFTLLCVLGQNVANRTRCNLRKLQLNNSLATPFLLPSLPFVRLTCKPISRVPIVKQFTVTFSPAHKFHGVRFSMANIDGIVCKQV